MEMTNQLPEANHSHTHVSQDEHKSPGHTSEMEGRRVVLVGSGDMTRALVGSLLRAGYNPVVATRNPIRAKTWLSGDQVTVCTVEEGLSLGDLVVVAIPAAHHNSLPTELLANKIVVDISNRSPGEPSEGLSLAEKLQVMLPESQVVKALNTMSAYVLQSGNLHSGREVPVCGGTTTARTRVMAMVREMGLAPVDMGGLKNARTLEDIPLSFFPEWKVAAIITGIIFSFFWILTLFRFQICPNLEKGSGWDWRSFNTLPLTNTQVSLAFTACFLLLLCYIPGMIAAYLQLWRGTKYSHFPGWLDTWLKARKQLGLLCLLLGSTHGCMAIFSKIRMGVDDVWWQSIYIACGSLLTAVLAILGITSLPSVSARLTWREFSVVQRYLGWTSVVLLTAHLTFAAANHLLSPLACYFLVSDSQIMVPLCFLTLMFKVPLLLPCVDSHLTKIRNGYERQVSCPAAFDNKEFVA